MSTYTAAVNWQRNEHLGPYKDDCRMWRSQTLHPVHDLVIEDQR
jgi:glutamate dehydrogenase/leucine dehydrogenase